MLVNGFRELTTPPWIQRVYRRPTGVTIVDDGFVTFAPVESGYEQPLAWTDVTASDKQNVLLYLNANPNDTVYLTIEPNTDRRQYRLSLIL